MFILSTYTFISCPGRQIVSWPRQGSQNSLENPKFEFKSWISWVWGRACQGKLGGCPPPKCFNTFLDLALDFFNLFLWSGIGTTPHSRLFKFRFQSQVHLDQFFTREGRRQGAEHLLIGCQQFLRAGVKVKTLEFLKEILLSMEVALSMFFLFLPISSFGRHRTIVPLRGTLVPIVQRIH